jgi:hypothetical protein
MIIMAQVDGPTVENDNGLSDPSRRGCVNWNMHRKMGAASGLNLHLLKQRNDIAEPERLVSRSEESLEHVERLLGHRSRNPFL